MSQIDRETYEEWRQLEMKRRAIAHDVLKRALGDECPAETEIPSFDEWLARGKPGELRIRRALAAFFGRMEQEHPSPQD